MKSLLYLLLAMFIQQAALGQDSDHVTPITPAIQAKIKQEVEQQAPAFKDRLLKKNTELNDVEFMVDMFRIERYHAKWVELNYSTVSMVDATYACAKLYDGLLNKYYKKLLSVLEPKGRNVLIQAQRSWLAFRDNETKLDEVAANMQFKGGTMAQVVYADHYENLIKERVEALYAIYSDIVQEH